MKIISKRKDYYDCIQKYGYDDSRYFIRKPKKINVHDVKIWEYLNSEVKEVLVNKIFNYNETDFIGNILIIGFCGKIYMVLQLRPDSENTVLRYNDEFFFYSYQEFIDFADNYPKLKKYIHNSISKKNTWRLWNSGQRGGQIAYIKSAFDILSGSDQFKQIFIKYKVPIFIYDKSRNEVLLNPSNLKEYKFPKIFHAYTAFQELEMYIGNLGLNDPKMVSISNKHLLEKKGFDNRYSFRKAPTKNKKR